MMQRAVGCVLKQAEMLDSGDDEDDAMDAAEDDAVYAFTTVLNLSSKKEIVSQLKTYLKGKAKDTSAENQFNNILGDSKTGDISSDVGLIINERFVNLPSEASVPMLESLLGDMEKSTRKGMPYEFSHYIFISKMYRLVDPPQTLHYVYPEDDLWAELQESDIYASFDYQMSSEMDTMLVDGGTGAKSKPITATLWRRVRVITSSGLLKLINIFKEGK